MSRILSLALLFSLAAASQARAAPLRIEAVIASSVGNAAAPLNGRLLVAISKAATPEPRSQISETFDSQQVYGLYVKQPSRARVILDGRSDGAPLARLQDLPEDDYFVQAVFNRYEVFRRSRRRLPPAPTSRAGATDGAFHSF